MSRTRSIASFAIALLLTTSCARARQTEVLVSIDADEATLATATDIRIRVRGASATTDDWTESFDRSYAVDETPLPILVALTPLGGQDDRRFEIVAEALTGTTVSVRVRAVGGYVRDEVHLLALRLDAACMHADCDPLETCSAGVCGPALVDVPRLPIITDPSQLDAGPRVDGARVDGAGVDAGLDASTDADISDATDASSQPDAFVCTPEVCEWGMCATGVQCNDPVDVATGGSHTCTRRFSGSVYCWGENGAGQVGIGTASMTPIPSPSLVGLPPIRAIATGGNHTCAVTTTNDVWCWGANSSGQLGDGTTMDHAGPMLVPALHGIADIVAGQAHTCARPETGTVVCWGDGSRGQLGEASTGSTTPIAVPGLADVVSLSAGAMHNCAVHATGAIDCWGAGSDGQLGNGATSDQPGLVPVLGIIDAVEVAAGGRHTCSRSEDTSVRCWGDATSGQVGNVASLSYDTPQPVASLDARAGTIGLALGDSHSCAMLASGSVLCWGADAVGQLGNDTLLAQRNMPSPVAAVSDAVEISAGLWHTCARRSSGVLSCWGQDESGQLGDGSAGDVRAVPGMVVAP